MRCILCSGLLDVDDMAVLPRVYTKVYLVRATEAKTNNYDYWTCGGALVTTQHVVTSAACITDITYLYVIAGYKKYVTDSEINRDPCTSTKKKKVIYSCTPGATPATLKYDRLELWSQIDIGIVMVESPYDFQDTSYATVCHYTPNKININYDPKYQDTNTDAIVLGWGHKKKWRLENQKQNFNQEKLHYAAVSIMDKEKCKASYKMYANMTLVIDKYMFCTNESGRLDAKGEPSEIIESEGLLLGCVPGPPSPEALKSGKALDCENQNNDYADNMDYTRRDFLKSNQTYNGSMTDIKNRTVIVKNSAVTTKQTRRNGICQNDHGGPIVTWVGTHEILIGVASVFKVSSESNCVGPFLYTSTSCNGAFLECVLSSDILEDSDESKNNGDRFRRALCKKDPYDTGAPTIERHISWLYHPDGPADNEKHKLRMKKENTLRKDERHPYIVNHQGTEANVNKNAAKYRFAPNEKHSAANAIYAPNPYAASNQYGSNNENPAYGMYAAQQYNAANGMHAAHVNYAANSNYGTNVNYAANGMYAASGMYQKNQKYPAMETYPAKVQSVLRNLDTEIVIRPQQALNG